MVPPCGDPLPRQVRGSARLLTGPATLPAFTARCLTVLVQPSNLGMTCSLLGVPRHVGPRKMRSPLLSLVGVSNWPRVSGWTRARQQPFGVTGQYDSVLTQSKRPCYLKAHLGCTCHPRMAKPRHSSAWSTSVPTNPESVGGGGAAQTVVI